MKLNVSESSGASCCFCAPSGLGHENAWIGLNDRTVEEDFQWTDAMDVVSLFLIHLLVQINMLNLHL